MSSSSPRLSLKKTASGKKRDKSLLFLLFLGAFCLFKFALTVICLLIWMSIISDSMAITASDGPLNTIMEVDFAKCDCCGLTEECTLSYIETIRARYQGKWICGLCAEAVKDESLRCHKLISPDEAMARHFNFCNKFRSSGPPEDPTSCLITAMRQILRKSLESPKSLRSMPSSPTKNRGDGEMKGLGLTRSESCIPSLSVVDSPVLCGIGEGCEL